MFNYSEKNDHYNPKRAKVVSICCLLYWILCSKPKDFWFTITKLSLFYENHVLKNPPCFQPCDRIFLDIPRVLNGLLNCTIYNTGVALGSSVGSCYTVHAGKDPYALVQSWQSDKTFCHGYAIPLSNNWLQ